MPDAPVPARRLGLGIALVILGALGLLAAWDLSVEKVLVLADDSHVPSCDVGVLVSCGTNLGSWQGSLFGFPNPFIGLMAWPVVITIGVALIGGIRLPRWFWIGFNVGVAGALAFVIWLISQSIFVLGVLCPWCMLTWAVTIPTFWIVTLDNLREGRFGGSERLRRLGAAWFGWIPLITAICYAVIILIAQLQLNAIPLAIIEIQNLLR